ncbi:MAG: hypothetical protein P8M70_08245, partial [Verrucomicrobiota bacterium]|nr:hypothetical protein [Verrucomicrobiota bacterium]
MLISSVGSFADGGKQVGPPNSVGGENEKGGKTNRTGIRTPWSDPSNSGKKPQNGKNPQNGKKPDGQGGERPDGQGDGKKGWKELLDLTDEQCKPFHAIMKRFHEQLKKIDSDKRLNPARKMEAREKARELRNRKLRGILTPEQFQKFLKIIHRHARPGKGSGPSDGDKPDGENSITRQQRAQMAKLMRWFSEQVRQVLRSNLSKEDKKSKIADLKNTYRQRRAGILSAEQAAAWAAIDGISVSGAGDSAGGGGDDSTGGPGPGSDPTGGPGPGSDPTEEPPGGGDDMVPGGPGPGSDPTEEPPGGGDDMVPGGEEGFPGGKPSDPISGPQGPGGDEPTGGPGPGSDPTGGP